jgi:dihydrodipicolinate synthase/N-acetylneuraminate lyase
LRIFRLYTELDMTLPRPLSGIVPPLVTPLAAPDRLDLPGLERLVARVVGAGCSGVFVLGSTGEAQALSYRLRMEMVRETCRLTAGRVPVLAGISDTALAESVSLGRQAAEAGAAGLVLAPPYYFRLSQPDILRYVESAAAELPVPVFLYNIPGLVKLWLEPETVARAAEHPNIAGFKDSSGDLIYFQRVLRAVAGAPGFSVFMGPEELLADALLLGAHGGVAGGANLRPELYVSLYAAAREGRIDEVLKLRTRVMDLSEHVYRVGEPSTSYFRGIKCALELDGVCSGLPAPPLERFSEVEAQAIRAWLQDN